MSEGSDEAARGKSFRDRYDLESRKRQYERVMASRKAAGRTPVIMEPEPGSKFDCDEVTPIKRLCHRSTTMSDMVVIARQSLPDRLMSSGHGIYLLVGKGNNTLVNGPTPVVDVYNEHKDEDGFLYITFSGENTFG